MEQFWEKVKCDKHSSGPVLFQVISLEAESRKTRDSKGTTTRLLKNTTICIDWKYQTLIRELNYKIFPPYITMLFSVTRQDACARTFQAKISLYSSLVQVKLTGRLKVRRTGLNVVRYFTKLMSRNTFSRCFSFYT